MMGQAFYATMESWVGQLLLCASHTHLVGVYFTGQKDCPVLQGLPVPLPQAADPTAGRHAGRALKALRASRQLSVIPVMPTPAAALQAPGEEPGELVYMQTHTPPDAVAILHQARNQLFEYFRGERKRFTVPLHTSGTDFQQRIWRALADIPYGELVSYGEIAIQAGLGRQHGRAVGSAVGRNPISIIIPCHRVLSSSGALTGYTGGLHHKYSLLQLEGILLE